MAATSELWCIKSERDNKLYLTGERFESWSLDPQRALVFPTAHDAEVFRNDWMKVHKPHWPCLVRRFVP